MTRLIPLYLVLVALCLRVDAQQSDLGSPGQLSNPSAADEVQTFRTEGRIPASFREVESGLEVVALHEDWPPMRLTQAQNPGIYGLLDVGDVLSSAAGRDLQSVEDLFDQLRLGAQPLPLQIVNIQTGMQETWTANPIPVQVPVAPGGARATGGSQVVFIHVVATDDSRLGPKIRTNIEGWKLLFDEHVASERVRQYTVLEGAECSASGIVDALSQAQVGPQDTLFLYYQGHGAYDPSAANQDPAAGHFLDFPRQDLRRGALLRAMQAKGARLTVLLTDACNGRAVMEQFPRSVQEMRVVSVEGWTGLEELLFCYRGTLDLTAASRGQFSWCTKDVGGWFTSATISALANISGGQTRSWAAAWTRIKQRTEAIYQARRDMYQQYVPDLARQPTLVPQEFVWEIQRDDPPDAPTERRMISLVVSRTVR